jgi:hypothetical protein
MRQNISTAEQPLLSSPNVAAENTSCTVRLYRLRASCPKPLGAPFFVRYCRTVAASNKWVRSPFDRACSQYGIEHSLTKPNHPWTNGQVERMNRTLKEATVQRYYYDTHEQLRQHLADFLAAYNFAKRLKMLKGLTPARSRSGSPFHPDRWRQGNLGAGHRRRLKRKPQRSQNGPRDSGAPGTIRTSDPQIRSLILSNSLTFLDFP